MKGLFCHMNEDVKFVLQDAELPLALSEYYVKMQVKACALSPLDLELLTDLNILKDSVPVGREIAGVVLEVGSKVTFFQPDDDVVGILPLDAKFSGLSDVILVHEHHLVLKPEKVNWVEAAGTIRDGLCAYTALHALSHVSSGKTVLVLDGASPLGIVTIQLAHHRGAKVLATALSIEDKQYLEQLRPTIGIRESVAARVINMSDGKVDLVESCLEETGGLGVDIILDVGVKLRHTKDGSTSQKCFPHKHDIITLLAIGGQWVTSEKNLQLDPPDSRTLFHKGATVSFLNDEVWNLSSAQQGKYLHIMKDIMQKLSIGVFRPQLDDPIPLYEATVSMEMVQKKNIRKRLVIQL
ncbi:quinone oxidoreductase-like protein 1 [Erpetoichthys calabaricus]|uniref:Crystallin, zeta (quinone reductase)-like 1 n=1 Tax=Erpetoichthys calabaricus TaxID=27687 RepID=A0A8C4RKN3_ERPCA|nr:quinone oxidoreductase-like protein 1 [Erpetoichthys calabaricus]